jgi:hypothetical protein
MWKQAKPIERHESEMARLALRALVWLFALVLGVMALEFATGCAMPPEHERQEQNDDDGAGQGPAEKVSGEMGMQSNKGWAVSGSLVIRDTTKKVSMQADFEGAAGAYTVQFLKGQYVFENAFLPETVPNVAEALITWSVRGNSQITRRVSVFSGLSITGVGEACSVQMQDVSNPFAPPWPSPLPFDPVYDVQASLSPGTRANVNQPPVLVPRTTGNNPFNDIVNGQVTVAGPGTGGPYPIPADAGVISMWASASITTIGVPPAGSVRINYYDQNGVFVGSTNVGGDSPKFEPIAPGATQYDVQNLNLVPVTVRLLFGIDG